MANNVVKVKRTSVSGRTPNTTASYATNTQYISAGELALNQADGILYSSNGSVLIEIGSNNTLQNISTNNLTVGTTFYVVSNGNIGVGTSSPGAKLTINGSANISGITTLSANLILGSSGVSANGSFGTAGHVLTTNGSATYWAAASGGSGSVNTDATYTWTNTHIFSNTTASGNATSGAVKITGGLGVANNIYVAGRVGWSNSTNISVVYQYYNATDNSLDTVFG